METNAYNKKPLSLAGIVILIIIVIIAALMAWLYLRKAHDNPLSNDAVIGATIVNIAASVPGRILSIDVAENQAVKQGELLFTLDPEPLRLLVEQTTADLEIAQAALETQRRATKAETQNALIADQQVTRARTNLDLAEVTLKRLTALSPKGYVTRQQVDDATTLRNDAQISLAQAIKQAEAANTLVGSLDSAEALVRARRAAQALAQHNLDNAVVRAPHAGRVEGIGWGVTSEELINIPRNLPYVPKNLNWVRIAQRFPVRVKLIDPPADLARAGASAVVTVHDGSTC